MIDGFDIDEDDDAPSAAEPSQTVKLAGRRLTATGVSLGLRPGDVLAAINGKPFVGTKTQLNDRFREVRGRPLALTFKRGELDITVLTEHSDLGRWEPAPAVTNWSGDRQDPEALRNWEILRGEDGRYDLHPLKPGVAALVFPPLWLMQNRLWAHAAAIVAVVAVAAAIWWVLVPFVYVFSGVIVRATGPLLFRLDRISMGLVPYATVAARTESGAHIAYGKIDPKGHFLYGKPQSQVEVELESEDQTAPETTA